MVRTKLADRKLPYYTKGEEIFNMVSHIVGSGFGLIALLACVIVAAYHQSVWGIVSGIVYGISLILLFTMSSIYHGLPAGIPKKVFQVLDHCTIFVLIAATYTPILLNGFREVYTYAAWINFTIIWGLAIVGIVLNSIDLRRFKIFSLVCYLGMGWFALFSIGNLIRVYGINFFIFLLLGGILYTVGSVIYVLGGKKGNKRYMHSVFHVFVNIAAIMHFLAIVLFVIPS